MMLLHNYHIISYGCQMNDHDSEKMSGMLEQSGYCPVDIPGLADIILVNTCCVRETAENKVYGLLGRLGKIKSGRPHLIIGIGGCMTQLKDNALRIRTRFPFVDFIFGTDNIPELPGMIGRALTCKKGVEIHINDHPSSLMEGLPASRQAGVKAWVPVMYGCNNFCTYCIVPYVRGRERSRQPHDIINEIRSLVSKGFCEVTLLGQNVNSYGRDIEGRMDFAGLLHEANNVEGLQRIRFMTSHPRDFSESLVESVAGCEKVCEHLHIPVQAGSNRILKAMNRGYSRESYLELVDKIRSQMPGASLTTDIMAGFPGETDEDFLLTVDMLERICFDSAYTFIYNVRKGTPAASMNGQVPQEEKKRRIDHLIKVQNRISLVLNRSEVGRVHQVLVEGPGKSGPGSGSGRTRTNKLVAFEGGSDCPGKTVNVKIQGYALTYLKGKVLE